MMDRTIVSVALLILAGLLIRMIHRGMKEDEMKFNKDERLEQHLKLMGFKVGEKKVANRHTGMEVR